MIYVKQRRIIEWNDSFYFLLINYLRSVWRSNKKLIKSCFLGFLSSDLPFSLLIELNSIPISMHGILAQLTTKSRFRNQDEQVGNYLLKNIAKLFAQMHRKHNTCWPYEQIFLYHIKFYESFEQPRDSVLHFFFLFTVTPDRRHGINHKGRCLRKKYVEKRGREREKKEEAEWEKKKAWERCLS